MAFYVFLLISTWKENLDIKLFTWLYCQLLRPNEQIGLWFCSWWFSCILWYPWMDTERNDVSCNYSKPTKANTILTIDILNFKMKNKLYYMFANNNNQYWGLTYVAKYLTNTEINLQSLRWKSAITTARIYITGGAILQNYHCRLEACSHGNMMGYSEISYVVIYWQTDMSLSLTSICKTIQRRIENNWRIKSK